MDRHFDSLCACTRGKRDLQNERNNLFLKMCENNNDVTEVSEMQDFVLKFIRTVVKYYTTMYYPVWMSGILPITQQKL